jgi:hypothetical protein
MRAPSPTLGTFEEVGECLYRHSSNGVYYARIKIDGKEIRRSPETADHVQPAIGKPYSQVAMRATAAIIAAKKPNIVTRA